MTKSVYDIIKRQNGEAFAKAIRRFDSGIFDIPNLPQIVRYAGRNALPILSFLEGLKVDKIMGEQTDKKPFELLRKAGYDAFYVDSLEKQNSIKPYFEDEEALCTFSDEKRFEKYHIIHCIKKGADKLKRSDFKGKEQREDEYGTSVISIQLLKRGNFIKICNRYNHTVNAPDNTFYSNPDNIIPGLLNAFEKYFGISLRGSEELMPDGFVFQNGQLFKFHTERNNCYIGDGFYVKDGAVCKLNKDYELMADCFIFNLKEKKITSCVCDQDLHEYDLVNKEIFEEEIKNVSLQVVKDGEGVLLLANNKPFLKLVQGAITEIYLEKATLAPKENSFLHLKKLVLKNVKEVGNDFLSDNYSVREFIAPKLERTGRFFISHTNVEKVFLPRLRKIGECSFGFNKLLTKLELNMLISTGECCFSDNKSLKSLEAHILKELDFECVCNNPKLEQVRMDSLKVVGNDSLRKNKALESLKLNKVKYLSLGSLCHMPHLKEIELRKLIYACGDNLVNLPVLKRLNAPNLEDIGFGVSLSHTGLEYLFLPALEHASSMSLEGNLELKEVYLPRLKTTCDRFSKCIKWPLKRGRILLLDKKKEGWVHA
ncbi:MAG: leucine-rich repeat protein [Alphaproteobacteria bacterium]|nr:leucine-rich repeat protein [Alphaproteobacteria bacterium]